MPKAKITIINNTTRQMTRVSIQGSAEHAPDAIEGYGNVGNFTSEGSGPQDAGGEVHYKLEGTDDVVKLEWLVSTFSPDKVEGWITPSKSAYNVKVEKTHHAIPHSMDITYTVQGDWR